MKLSEVITSNKQSAKPDYQSETLIFSEHRIPSSLPLLNRRTRIKTRTQSNRQIWDYYREDRTACGFWAHPDVANRHTQRTFLEQDGGM